MSADLFLGNLLLYTLQVALVAAAVLALPTLFGLRDPSALQRWYQAAIALILLLPLLHVAEPLSRGTVSITFGPASLEDASRVAGGAGGWHPSIALGVLLLLASGAALHVLRLGVGLAALARRYRSAEPLSPVPEPVQALLRRAGVSPKLLLAGGLEGAQAFGFLRPAVLLPGGYGELPAEAQASVLAHELGHLRRHDGLAVLLEELARALLWFNPAIWLLLDRAALCREQAADASAVALTGERRQYVETLVAVAAARAGHALVPAVPYLTRGHLLKRVALLTKEVKMDRNRLAWALPAAGTLAFCVAVLTAWAFPLVVPAAPAAPPPAGQAAEKAPPPAEETPKLLNRVNPVYPHAAIDKGLQGQVSVELVVDEAGKVAEARVLESSDPVFDAPSLEAVRQWTFAPPQKDGKPSRARFSVTLAFKLK